jgi:hypothetical protein
MIIALKCQKWQIYVAPYRNINPHSKLGSEIIQKIQRRRGRTGGCGQPKML